MTTTTIQALLFDLGGVLIDIDFKQALRVWEPMSSLSFDEMQEAFQHDVAYRRHETGEIGAKEYFESLRASLKLEGTDEQIAGGWNAILRGEIVETVDLVHKARARLPCYLFTNSNPTHVATCRSRFPEVMEAFNHVFVSSDIGLRKPGRAAFEYISRAVNVAADAILFFDDTLENVTGALAAGLQAVHVKGPDDVHTTLRQLGCVP
jgi:HAD superfamily hydrolase (TIGR01509 family)